MTVRRNKNFTLASEHPDVEFTVNYPKGVKNEQPS